MERGSGHNDKLDLWKCVAIYSVIFIHILLPGQIGVAVNCLARFAVPLFFPVSYTHLTLPTNREV